MWIEWTIYTAQIEVFEGVEPSEKGGVKPCGV